MIHEKNACAWECQQLSESSSSSPILPKVYGTNRVNSELLHNSSSFEAIIGPWNWFSSKTKKLFVWRTRARRLSLSPPFSPWWWLSGCIWVLCNHHEPLTMHAWIRIRLTMRWEVGESLPMAFDVWVNAIHLYEREGPGAPSRPCHQCRWSCQTLNGSGCMNHDRQD